MPHPIRGLVLILIVVFAAGTVLGAGVMYMYLQSSQASFNTQEERKAEMKKKLRETLQKDVPANNQPAQNENPRYEEKIVWVPFNYSKGANTYSFERPFYGPYCNGCIDGYKGPDALSATTISGGLFSQDDTRGWLLTNAFFPEGTILSEDWWGYLKGDYIGLLNSIEVNQSVQRVNESAQAQITITRLPDIQKQGITFRQYETNNTSLEKSGKQQFMVFDSVDPENPGTFVISVEYVDELYAGMYQHILDTFSTSIRQDVGYEEAMKEIKEIE